MTRQGRKDLHCALIVCLLLYAAAAAWAGCLAPANCGCNLSGCTPCLNECRGAMAGTCNYTSAMKTWCWLCTVHGVQICCQQGFKFATCTCPDGTRVTCRDFSLGQLISLWPPCTIGPSQVEGTCSNDPG